ncbi:MAG: hypothetical protein LQ342_002490 [Letrouitia transgressa]|nr:MAG: hypothetical protein LQ342_002490 [Letrouitia transgressa]
MTFCNNRHQYVGPYLPHTEFLEPIVSTAKKTKGKYKEYSYEELPKNPGSIRVLRLQGNSSVNAEVECELLKMNFDRDKDLDYPYEALSWCWGTAKTTQQIIILEGEKNKRRLSKSVTPDLVAALKALRYRTKSRFLWIDQVCIDQDNSLEKNHQVEMMADIYGRATKVCIWLGDGDRSSKIALDFIKREVLQLQNFDDLCGSEQASEKWSALLDLMQRPWFSRRWVVQEVALAHRTVVYCGDDKISWKKFAVAVELFVEVETATHRLSEVMKKDPRFYHVPGWFEYVSALGASLLVEATGKLFRDYKPNGPTQPVEDLNSDSGSEMDESDGKDADSEMGETEDKKADSESKDTIESETMPTKYPVGQPLLSLEYLVSSLSIFEVTKPHDAVYALLAISRDTVPVADDQRGFRRQLVNTQYVLEGFTQGKRYTVDYQQPFADVCKEFVSFCIEWSKDSTRALDIICRPWAPDVTSSDPKYTKKRKLSRSFDKNNPKSKRSSIAEGRSRLVEIRRNQSRDQSRYNSLSRSKLQKEKYIAKDSSPELPLPSWIPSLSGAAYAMYSQAGVHTLKMGRKNADTLVGLPASSQSLERNYNAAGTKGVDLKSLRFVKRPNLKHWSMYVQGFVLDKVIGTQPSSQGGAIPRSWAKAGGWFGVPESDPPDEFWRTLVADRGRDGRNPPVYYSSACKESFNKGGLSSGSVNLTDLINNERCSVIAQFCRRVQAVIWNRCLITTKSETPAKPEKPALAKERLGLTGQDIQRGDLICILYGCSVPVALRRIPKSKEDIQQEMEDELSVMQESIKNKYRRPLKYRQYRRLIKNCDRALKLFWERKMRNAWREDADGWKTWEHRKPREGDIVSEGYKNHYKVSMQGESFSIATIPGEEVDELLHRRAYEQWKAQKREREEFPKKWFRAGDKRAFELQYRYGPRMGLKKIKEKRAGKNVETARNESRHEANGTNPPVSDQNTNSDYEKMSEESGPNIRDTSDDYVRRYKDRYLKPYKTNEDAIDLEEPDWKLTDRHSLGIQDKWCYYQFLGECYLHGMMDGEAMAYQNENGVPPRTFELR